MNKLTTFGDKMFDKIVEFTPNLVSALLLLIIGIYVIKFIIKIVRKLMSEKDLEPTLSNFLANILFWTLRILLLVTVITQLGIGTSSFVAILGAAGLAVGLSLQGSLSNFSGGILIIVFKPFKVNDLIEAQGVTGTVCEIQIFVTKIISGNNQTIFIPNGALSNGVITNYSMQGYRKAELNFSISYETNIKQVKDIIMSVMQKDSRILPVPKPEIIIKQLTDSAVILSVRPCATNENYSNVCSDTLEQCKIAFYEAGIDFQPFVKEINK